MPRKKKITETVTAEKVESVVGTEATENKQAEAKLEEASLDGLKVVEKVEVSEEQASPKQRKPRAKRGMAKKEVEVKAKDIIGKKTSAKKDTTQEKQIYIQYVNREVNIADIEERVKKAWESEGHRAGSIKKLDIYIKPEEYAVYYVINGKNAGRVDF